MSAIKHTELFDFPAYEAAIKDTQQATKEFGNEVSSVLKRIKQDQKGLTDDLKKYADTLKSFSTAVNNAGAALKQFSVGIDETKRKMSDSQAVQSVLTATIDAQKQAVKELKEQYKLQKQALEALNPADENFKKNQTDILGKVKQTYEGIKVYNDTLRKTRDSVGVAEGSYRAMVARLNELRTSLRNLPGAFDPVSGKLNRANKEAVTLSNEITKLDTSVKRADASMGIFARNVGNYGGALNKFGAGLASGLLATLGVGSAFEALRGIFDVNRDFEQLNQALLLVSGSTEKFAENQKFLLDVTERYGIEIEGTTRAFNKFFASSTNAGLSAEQTKQIFDQVSKVAANLKLSQDDVNGVFTAFAQIAGKGKVQAEELRGQIGERIPAAAAIAARSLNITETELSKLLETGSVLANDFLPKFALELEKTFGKEDRVESLNASVQRFFNTIKTGVQDEGVTRSLSALIDLFTFLAKTVGDLGSEITDAFSGLADLLAGDPGRTNRLRREREEEEKIAEERKKEIEGRVEAYRLEEDAAKRQIILRQQQQRVNDIARKVTLANSQALKEEFRQIRALETSVLRGFQAFEKAQPGNLPNRGGAPKGDKGPKGPTQEQIDRKAVDEAQKFYKELADLELSQQKLLLSEKKITEEQYQQEVLNIRKDYIDAAIELERSLGENANQTNIIKFQTESRAAQTEFNNFINKQNEDALKAQQKFLDSGFNRTKDSLNKRGEEEKAKLDAQFEAEKASLDMVFALASKGRDRNFNDEIRYLEALKKLKLKYGREITEDEIAEERARAQLKQQIALASIDLGAEAANSALQIVVDQNQARFDAIVANINKKREEELAAAGNNAAAREAIEKKYNERLRQENIRKAKADKTAALFRIAISTAEAIARSVAISPESFGLPFSAFAAATGALQAAVVAARPLPQFRKGTKSAPRGLAVVGEEGSELIERNGKYSITPGKPTLVKLQGGEKIYTAKETTRIIERAEKQSAVERSLTSDRLQSGTAMTIIREKEINQTRALAEAVRLNESFLADAFRSAVKGIPINQVLSDERGVRKRQIEQNNRKTSLNRL